MSHSVYAAMHTMVSLGKLDPPASNTADFVKKVNDIFDFVNIRCGKDKRKAYSGSEKENDYLNRSIDTVSHWYIMRKKNRYVPPCFSGLVQFLNVLKCLCKDLVYDGPFKFILSGRINQDCIENLFSQVRSKGGHRFNPSAREFRYAYRNLCTNMLLASIPTANCDFDKDELLICLSTMSKTSKTSDALSNTSPKPGSSHSSNSTPRKRKLECVDGTESECKKSKTSHIDIISITDFQLPNIVKNVVAYIAGYLIRKFKQFECEKCLEMLTSSSNESTVVPQHLLLTHYKVFKHKPQQAFGSLYVPSENFLGYLERVEGVFEKHVSDMLSCDKILGTMLNTVHKYVPNVLVEFCEKHNDGAYLDFLLRLYLRCRLHYYCKFESKKLVESKGKRNKKAQILENE